MEDVKIEEENNKLEKYRKIIFDIELLTKNLRQYQDGNRFALGDESYAQAVNRLYSLRCRQNSTDKKIKKRYDNQCL